MPVKANLNKYSLQAGAWGDDASKGSTGVRVEIRTHIYNADYGAFDYFWVGDNLLNGSFIQFGYGYEPGSFCLREHEINNTGTCQGGSDNLKTNDARWQWQYWPNGLANNFYYGVGPANSVGSDGSWHTYSIVPVSNGWSFLFDNQQVDSIPVEPTPSKDPAYIVAEKSTNSAHFGNLGPVEFRNLSYEMTNGWHSVNSLISLHGCSSTSNCTGVQNPYGAVSEGSNDIIAGSGIGIVPPGNLLWTARYVTLVVNLGLEAKGTVTCSTNATMFANAYSARLPQGMLAYVQLYDTKTAAPGFLGTIGFVEVFTGWTGDANTSDAKVTIMMDTNKSIEANWRIYATVTSIFVMTGLTLVVIVLLVLCVRRRRS